MSRSHYNEKYLALLSAYINSSQSHGSAQALSPNPDDAQAKASTSPGSALAVSAASGHVSNIEAERLYHFIAQPRSRCIEFAAKAPGSGTTLLHEAVRRKDLGLIKLAISKGADTLARDKKGKLPVDLAKDDRIKSVLRQGGTDSSLTRCTNAQ